MFTVFLDKSGVPAHLILVTKDDFNEETLVQVRAIVSSIKQRRVIIVTGPQSPAKEKVIPFLMRQFFGFGLVETMAYISNVEWGDNFPEVDGYAFVNACIYPKKSIEKVRSFLFDRVLRRKIIILDCTSEQRLVEIYGSDFMEYIEHLSIIVEIKPDISMPIRI